MGTRDTWELFQAGEEPRGVRREVLTSWRRSRFSGVDPEHVDVPFVEKELDTRFARVAVPILARAADMLVADRSCLALSDASGSVLWRWVSEPMLRNTLDDLSVVEGFCFGEEYVGTNGLGTSLETGALAVVRGSEHYVQRFHDVACVAAPVRHPVTRRTVGAVNLTCRAADTNALLAVVVRMLVDEVVAALHEHATARERRLLDAFLAAQRRTAGPVAVVGDGLIIANPQAADLGLDRPDLWDEVRATRATRMDLPADLTAQVRLVGDTAGAVLTVPDPPAPRRAAGPPGSHDPWTAAVARVRRARGPVAVCGEAGTGKRTVVRAAFGEATVLDAATYAADGPAAWVGALRAALDGPVLVRHVELLDAPAAHAVGAVLAGASAPVGLTVTVPFGADPGATPGAAVLRDELTAATVTLPPLRHHPDTAVALARAELRRLRPELAFAPDALAGLRRHHWPGNVAELVRVVRDAADAGGSGDGGDGGVVGASALPEQVRNAADRRALTPLERAELSVISEVLRAHGGNKSTAARELGISRTALYAKIRTYRL